MAQGAPKSPAGFRANSYLFSIQGDDEAAQVARLALSDLESADRYPAAAWLLSTDGDRINLSIDGRKILSRVSRLELAAHLVSVLTRQVLDQESDLLHLHSAAVTNSGGAMLIAGPSGAGKSTLCTALLSDHWGYISDEVVGVNPESLQISSFPKPLSIKKHGTKTVEHLANLTSRGRYGAPWVVKASELGNLAPTKQYNARTLVLYGYKQGATTKVEPVHRATMVRELLADSQDANRMGHRALEVAVRLVTQATCLRATGSDAIEVAAELRRAHSQPVTEGAILQLDGLVGEGPGPRRSAHITSLQLDGRALLFDAKTSRVIELNETTSIWWSLFDGTALNLLAQDFSAELDLQVDDALLRGRTAAAQLDELGVI